MPKKRKYKKKRRVTNQQAEGIIGDLAKKAVELLGPLVKKQIAEHGPRLAEAGKQEALRRVRATKLGKQLGVGKKPKKRRKKKGGALKLPGQGTTRGKQVRKRRRRPAVSVVMS